jgi:hypothetical protein
VNAPAAARTYRIGGIQPYVMLLVLSGCAAFSPVVLAHAVYSRSWLELTWAVIVVWFFCSTVWRAAYRIDVRHDTVEFRSILWRRVSRCVTCAGSAAGGDSRSCGCAAERCTCTAR